MPWQKGTPVVIDDNGVVSAGSGQYLKVYQLLLIGFLSSAMTTPDSWSASKWTAAAASADLSKKRKLAAVANGLVDGEGVVVGTVIPVAHLDFVGATVSDFVTPEGDPGKRVTITNQGGVPITSTPPVAVTKAPAVLGVIQEAARSDHKHDIATAAPTAVGTANAEGTATSLARSDHVHALGTVDDAALLGGLRVVADNTARDAIPSANRKTGMFVLTVDTYTLWVLQSAPGALPGTWKKWGTNTAVTDALPAAAQIYAGDPVAINASSALVRASSNGAATEQEVYGLAVSDAAPGETVDVVTKGVLDYTGITALPSPGTVLYLKSGGGWSDTPPPLTSPGERIVRLGRVRTASTVQVQIQIIAMT